MIKPKAASFTRLFSLLCCLIALLQVLFLYVVHFEMSSDKHKVDDHFQDFGAALLIRDAVVANVNRNPPVSNNNKKNQRFAYAYLIAGCNPKNATYHGFLYNVLVSRRILQMEGSTADVVLLLRMQHPKIASSLPQEEERWLHESGIRIHYLPPLPAAAATTTEETFYSAMMSKFYILNLTDYSRVLYLDADVMPLCNLDYVFELSERGVLKENFVVGWRGEPALGAIFMLQPGFGEYERLQDIIALQRQRSENKWPPFDQVQGWGHKIEPPDHWYALRKRPGTLWNFQFAFADQGLLYHWVKYVKRSVSIAIGRRVLNYSNKYTNGTVVGLVEQAVFNVFDNVTCPRFPWDTKTRKGGVMDGAPFYHDFKHFIGTHKPWEKDNVKAGIPHDVASKSEATSPHQWWFHILRILSRELNMTLDVERLSIDKPSLGRFPILAHMLTQRNNTG